MSLTKLLAFNTNEKKILLCVMLTAMMMLTTGFTNSSIPTDMHQVSIDVDGRTITTKRPIRVRIISWLGLV